MNCPHAENKKWLLFEFLAWAGNCAQPTICMKPPYQVAIGIMYMYSVSVLLYYYIV